jgi:hypothetical protein
LHGPRYHGRQNLGPLFQKLIEGTPFAQARVGDHQFAFRIDNQERAAASAVAEALSLRPSLSKTLIPTPHRIDLSSPIRSFPIVARRPWTCVGQVLGFHGGEQDIK